MEAAVAEFEERRRRREALDQAAAASRDAAEALERETRDAARAVANLRDQRRRSEAARAVSAASPIASRAGPGRDAIPSDDESEALAQLQARRARIDARIDALLRDTDHARARIQTGGEPAEAGVADENLARRAAAEVEATYVQPRWKQRQEERWAAEARAAVAEMEAFDAAATRGVSKATSRASDLFAAARAVHENDTETLRRLLASRARYPPTRRTSAATRSYRCRAASVVAARRRRYSARAPTSTPKTPPGSRPWSGASRRDTSNSRISSSSGPNDTACAWETSERAGRGGATSEGDE